MAAESKLQSKGRDLLKKAGWYVTKVISCSTPGFPDQLAFRKSRVVCIEWKAPGKQPTELQKHVHRTLQEQGIEVVLADKIEDIQHLLN